MARANLKRLEEGKLYYSISEVCAMTGLEQHVLRYWESEFPQLRPKKNRSGNRAYRTKEIKIIRYIRYLLYDELYTIPGAKKKMAEANMADLDGQLSLIRLPPAEAAVPARPRELARRSAEVDAGAGENDGPEGADPRSAEDQAVSAEGLPEPAPGPEAAAEEERLRGELQRVKEELRRILSILESAGMPASAGREPR